MTAIVKDFHSQVADQLRGIGRIYDQVKSINRAKVGPISYQKLTSDLARAAYTLSWFVTDEIETEKDKRRAV